jgi:hypothetical protein
LIKPRQRPRPGVCLQKTADGLALARIQAGATARNSGPTQALASLLPKRARPTAHRLSAHAKFPRDFRLILTLQQ